MIMATYGTLAELGDKKTRHFKINGQQQTVKF